MSDTNRVQVGIVEESVFGTTPATPAFETQRITGAPDLAYAPVTVKSEELRADRQVSDLVLVGAEAGGGYGFELTMEAQDSVIQAAMFSTWVIKPTRIKTSGGSEVGAVAATSYAVNSGDDFVEGVLVRASGFAETGNNKLFRAGAATSSTSIATTGSTIEATPPVAATLRTVGFQGDTADIEADADGLISTLLDFTTLGLSAGQWIKVGGSDAGDQFATAILNDWCRILTVAANAIVFDIKPTGWTSDLGTGKDIMVFMGDYIINGVTKRYFSIEETFTDHSPVTYEYYTGMVVDTLSLAIPAQSIVTGSVAFAGKDASITETRFSGATTVAASLNSVMNSSSNVGRIAQDGEEISGDNYVLEANIEIGNNLRMLPAVGSLGAIAIGAGEFMVSGNFNTYFDSKLIAEKILANTATSFDMRFKDADTGTFVIDIPRLKYASGSPTVPGKNQDVTLNAEFEAIQHPTLGYMLMIQRFWEVQ